MTDVISMVGGAVAVAGEVGHYLLSGALLLAVVRDRRRIKDLEGVVGYLEESIRNVAVAADQNFKATGERVEELSEFAAGLGQAGCPLLVTLSPKQAAPACEARN